jgi:hypothetical protein
MKLTSEPEPLGGCQYSQGTADDRLTDVGAQNGRHVNSAGDGTRQESNGRACFHPDRSLIETFAGTLFRCVLDCKEPGLYLSLRTFPELRQDKAVDIVGCPLDGGLALICDRAERLATNAATNAEPLVFAPPIAVFNDRVRAAEINLVFGVVLSVECDAQPCAALKQLVAVLGAPTLVVASGGLWTALDGHVEPKLHGHWRLTAPAATPEELTKLKAARRLACAPSSGSICCTRTGRILRMVVCAPPV